MLTRPVRVMIGARHQVTSPLLVEIWLLGEARSMEEKQEAWSSSKVKCRSKKKRSTALGICEILWLKLLL